MDKRNSITLNYEKNYTKKKENVEWDEIGTSNLRHKYLLTSTHSILWLCIKYA